MNKKIAKCEEFTKKIIKFALSKYCFIPIGGQGNLDSVENRIINLKE